MRKLITTLALATIVPALAAAGVVGVALAPADVIADVIAANAADPIPGGARDVVAISPAPAGPAITVHLSNGAADVLRPCRYEDGQHCYWDASERGNGIGHDVVTTRGRVHYVDIEAMVRTWREVH